MAGPWNSANARSGGGVRGDTIPAGHGEGRAIYRPVTRCVQGEMIQMTDMPTVTEPTVLSITHSTATPEQAQQIEAFLSGFLPRLKAEQAGVVAAYHYVAGAQATTVIAWASEAARLAYRNSDLIKEPLAMEQRLGTTTVREAYPVTIAV
jgi:hypothetical protein